MKPVRLDDEAQTEVDVALLISRKAAEFRVALQNAFDTISANPAIGAKVSRYPVRLYIMPDGYPYSIIYGDEPTAIRIVAFAHHKRRPGYWKKRLRQN